MLGGAKAFLDQTKFLPNRSGLFDEGAFESLDLVGLVVDLVDLAVDPAFEVPVASVEVVSNASSERLCIADVE